MLTFTTNETHLFISGKTFDVKETLKNLRASWDCERRVWSLPIALDTDFLRRSLTDRAKEAADARRPAKKELSPLERAEKKEAAAKKKAARLYAASSEGKKAALMAALAEKEKGNGAYHWICCDQCNVIDWARQHTSCEVHAIDCGLYKNTFSVRGMIYTGD